MSVVIATPDVVGERMAGPGIRAYHFASELGKHFPTTLVAEFRDFVPRGEPFRAISRGTSESRRAIAEARVVVGQPTRELLAIRSDGQRRVYDLFDPVVLELRELYGAKPRLREALHLRLEWTRLRHALARGDLLIAAAPRQRDFYAGVHASASGAMDGWGARWIDVPFGVAEIPAGEPLAIDASEPLILWGGGMWDWLDPATAVRAVDLLNARGVRCKLLFLGTSRPHEGAARASRAELPPSANAIVNGEWVPYRDRGRWLRAAKVAIMLHRPGLEAEFSIRTRLFDAMACGLPVVATAGGFAADLVEKEGLGVVVPAEDPVGVAAGIEQLLGDDALYARSVSHLEQIRPRYLWNEVVRPLVAAVSAWMRGTTT